MHTVGGNRNLREVPSDFVNLTKAVPGIEADVRYYGVNNFVGQRIDGYEEPALLITCQAAQALGKVAEIFKKQGYGLRVFDAYRPQRAVGHFVRWAKDIKDVCMKDVFYPEHDKATLFDKGYIAYRSSHSRGSTVDLTLFDLCSGKELDMGGGFDLFSERSHHGYEGLTKQQADNRRLLLTVMEGCGFEGYDSEWWHYTLKNEPYPDTYFDFPVRN